MSPKRVMRKVQDRPVAAEPQVKASVDLPTPGEPPLVFISHDGRDADLAESFSKLLKSVSAGMLKSFRSSDKTGTEGIEFGDEWYKTLMGKLDSASDVVCLLTERSLDRPWILYEAGVAKGKLGKPVHGIALGVPLSRVSVGPFYQFQNSDDSEESLSTLVLQLCRRIPGLEPDKDVVKTQVQTFKTTVDEVLKTLGGQKKPEKKEAVDEAVAKVLEEMKLIVRELPMRLEHALLEGPQRFRSRRALRQLNPRMINEMAHMLSLSPHDPIGILMIASVLREDFPWLYEIGLDAYQSAKKGNTTAAHKALTAFRDATDMTIRGPFSEEMGIGSKETHSILRELPMIIDHYMKRILEGPPRRRTRMERSRGPKSE